MKTANPLSKVSLLAAGAGHVALSHAFQSTPVMGWNSYNQMSCSPNAQKIEDTINALSDRGFIDVGYLYFQIDCGWASRDGERNATTGALKIDTDAFPDGLAPLSDLARSKGMKWSMYSDAGYLMCDPQVPSPVLGSLNHETADAQLFQSLNTEYVKYDNCYAGGTSSGDNAPKDPRTDFVTRYSRMWDALQQVGISGMLVCEWGVPFSTSTGLEGPAEWTKGLATSFRLSDDIGDSWSNVYRIYNQAVYIANSGLVGPGHLADADLLEVGNSGMTFDEQATHFAAWAMLKSALMISTDISALSDATVAVLQNRGLIAINQDSAGQPIKLVQRWTSDRDLWVGDLANDDLAVLMVDLSNTQRELTLNLADIGLTSATIENLWTGENVVSTGSYSADVNAHGSLPLRLSNTILSSVNTPSYNFISASTGTLSNGAVTESCSGCTSSSKVSYIGGSSGGEAVLSNIQTSQATQDVRFDYINCDVGYGGSTNERLASISVNGGSAQTVSFPLSGYNWVEDVYQNYTVELSGFNTNGPNTISITGVGGAWAPDLDRIGVVA